MGMTNHSPFKPCFQPSKSQPCPAKLLRYERMSVRPYNPNPTQWFSWQRDVTPTKGCFKPSLWHLCCPSPSHCVNYFGAHGSSNRNCPMYQDRRPFRNFRISLPGHPKNMSWNQTYNWDPALSISPLPPGGADTITQTVAHLQTATATVSCQINIHIYHLCTILEFHRLFVRIPTQKTVPLILVPFWFTTQPFWLRNHAKL
jgi:hypothetical protein